MGKLVKILIVLVVLGGLALYFVRSGALDKLTASPGNKEGVRVEEKYGFTSEPP